MPFSHLSKKVSDRLTRLETETHRLKKIALIAPDRAFGDELPAVHAPGLAEDHAHGSSRWISAGS